MKRKQKKTQEIDMVNGPLGKNILFYSIPLMFSNILQVLFNMSDIAVVGRFAGPQALGAVGSTSILIVLATGINLGIASGVNAITAMFLGGGRQEQVHKSVHTSIILCLLAGCLITLTGGLFSERILEMMNTKPELIAGAAVYLKIYLCGAPALALYNYGNAILSAAGDTKRPLAYLSFAGVLNVLLNLFFVIALRLDVVGVALASIISQYVSAALILKHLMRCREIYKLEVNQIRIDGRIARRILYIGIPAAIQHSVFCIANLFVQTAVNYFDHVVVEGNSAAANADALFYDMMAAFYTACTSFIAQNLGAGNKKRIMQVYAVTTAYSFLLAAGLGCIFVIGRIQFLSLFTNDADVIRYGIVRLVIMSCSYCFSAFMDNALAAARGIGKSVVPTVIVIMGSVVFRVIWIYTVFAHFHTLVSIYLLYICSWILTAIAGNIYFFQHYKKLLSADRK